MTPKKTLKKWFSNLMKPAQEHFAAWIDSFWHKSEQIPMSNIDGLSRAIENTASAKQLLNHLNDTNAHRALFDELKNQIQAIQTILQVDDVNLDTLQEIVTLLKSNTKLQELIDKKVNKEEGKGLSSNDFTNEHKQKLEGLQPTDVSGLLPKGGYDGTGQQLKEAIDGLQTKMQQVETTLSVDDTAFDTLQEIVTQVKSNKNLETLLTGKVDKEVYFEKLKEILQINFNNGVNEVNLDSKMGSTHISSEFLQLYGKESASVIGSYASISSNVTTAIESKGGVYVRSFNGGSQILPSFQVEAQKVSISGDQTNKCSINQYKTIELVASETIDLSVPTVRINGSDPLERIETLEKRLVELEQRVNYPAT